MVAVIQGGSTVGEVEAETMNYGEEYRLFKRIPL
jgi:hypothetical protein